MFNPFKYYKLEKEPNTYPHGYWGISISSIGEDRNASIILWLWKYSYCFKYKIINAPLQPYFYDWNYKNPVTGEKKLHRDMVARKSLSFMLVRDFSCLSMDYGADNNFVSGDTKLPSWNKYWFNPFNERHSVKEEVLDFNLEHLNDGTHYSKENHEKYVGVINFYDGYDQEEIDCLFQIRRTVYVKAPKKGFFKFIKYFRRNEVSTYLEFKFMQEVGKEKRSWKGGVIGSGFKIENNILIEKAISDWSIKEGHTLIKIKEIKQ